MSAWAIGKRSIRNALTKSKVVHLASRLSQPRVVVLRYHSVHENPERYKDSIGTGIIHPLEVFERQVKLVARRYVPLSLDEILLLLKEKKRLPRKAVAVTFDDGYVDNVSHAAPVLNRMKVPAAFYVVVGAVESRKAPWFCRLRRAFATTRSAVWTDSVGGNAFTLDKPDARRQAFRRGCERCARLAGMTQEAAVMEIERELQVDPADSDADLMMRWEDLRTLRKAGHIVGSHTMSHPNLAHVHDNEIGQELGESKARLEKELGEPILHFAYPHPILNPHWNEETVSQTRRMGFATAVTTTPGTVCAGDDPLKLRRISSSMELDEFAWQLDAAFLGYVR